MSKMIGRIVIGGIAGLVIGYFAFGKGIDIGVLIPSGAGSGIGGALRNAAGNLVDNLAGISEIRRNILLSGAGGAGLGLLSVFAGKRR